MENKTENPMRKIKIEKVVLSIGATGEELEKGVKLLERLSNQKPSRRRTRKRIPSLGVRPKLEIGVVVTVREDVENFLKRMLLAVNNKLKRKQMNENGFSFGIEEYIEIPGTEYQRDVGIMGLDVTVAFKRAGQRVKLKKIKKGKIPRRQMIGKEEVINFMEEKFQTRFE